mgnify:CR=1 FL=1
MADCRRRGLWLYRRPDAANELAQFDSVFARLPPSSEFLGLFYLDGGVQNCGVAIRSGVGFFWLLALGGFKTRSIFLD